MTNTALTLHTVNEQQLVLDTDLAERLGMSRPRDIRANLIEANKAELQTLGILREMNANTGQRGRPAKAYYLNEEQALLVCMFSRTEKASAVRKLVIDTFMAVRRGQQPIRGLAIPNFANPAETTLILIQGNFDTGERCAGCR